jgi:hypothetical protein
MMKLLATYALGAAALIAGAPLYASTVNISTGGSPANVPALTGFQTDGNEMVGMAVTAAFTTFTETLAWAATGANSGGVSGTGWSISVVGDTFNANAWSVQFDGGLLLTSLAFDGPSGLTVFDRTEPNQGTPGSAQGRDYSDNLPTSIIANVTYSNAVGVGGATPVGDLWNNLLIDYSASLGGGVGGAATFSSSCTDCPPPMISFEFSQDTDTVAVVPIPAAAWLFGSALVGMSGLARRKKATKA